ncbi:hemagglutinin repeat-containing protein [Marinospirillum alkaliphilum]|uniref:Filamentous hemagglutinin family N-terminal domain-containing protein n=1 Tax=Marinospirillum alkaliphilum DSM 21637 TaxID=1122209 RepID=A0A1K1YP49_9GAMM|nr:hemagglutinin repeat-containing protein [Marinospirillum alkaliphilum]SFX63786.1 filamentous hemagglutinin family N-terminal domain-containing protein [Marinospirillum alkaliphilum DSM 21637]
MAHLSGTSKDRRLGFTATQRKHIALAVLISYLLYPGALLAQGIEAASGSPHAPQITESQNNIPVVNINRPNSSGVSRNQYNQFNVGQQGLILNNSNNITQTQLAGYIDGNASLKGRQARIILNEVTSANPSHLRGYTEVAGASAEFILANPNGITCNGCGFINIPRSTLTTGHTHFNSDGSLAGFRVEGGQIAIEGAGLNAANVSQLDLLSRTIRINGELWADHLNLVTGRNSIDHASLQATPLEAEVDPDVDAATTTPEIALDVAAIGGMYANVIRMVGTEKGFGVNSQGQMIAEQDFTLSAEGRITLSGVTHAIGGELAISTPEWMENTGFVGGQQVSVDARQIHNTDEAVMVAEHRLALTATEAVDNAGGMQAADIEVNSGSFNNSEEGILFAENSLTIRAEQDLDNQGALVAEQLELQAARLSNTAGGVLLAFGDADIRVDETLLNASSTIEVAGHLHLEADTINNVREVFEVDAEVTVNQYRNINISVSGKYDSGTRTYTETITEYEVVADSEPGYILAGLNLTLLGSINNIYSVISAGQDLSHSGGELNNLDYTAVNSNVHAGRDRLSYPHRSCRSRVAGYCTRYRTITRTENRDYNRTTTESVTLAEAIFSAGQNLTGQISQLNNGMSVDQLAQSHRDSERDATLPSWRLGDAGYRLPTGGLTRPSSNPDHPYLIATDPRLTSYKSFISSDYMLSRMDHDPSATVKRLGDGFVEQRLVRDQLLNQTGFQHLSGFTDLEQQYLWLMENALNQAAALSLSPGIALTAEQISLLQEPIVWMVQETFETPNGVQTALVPKVYLGTGQDLLIRSDGALLAAGNNLTLEVADAATNNGNIQAGSDLNLSAENLINTGDITAGNDLTLTTEGDLVNQGGVIAAGADLALTVGGDLVNETESERIDTYNQVSTSRTGIAGVLGARSTVSTEKQLTGTQTLVGREASISGGNVNIQVGGDVRMTGARLSAEEQLLLQAGGSISLNALQTREQSRGRNHRINEVDHLTNQIQAGGDLQLIADGALYSEATHFEAGRDLLLQAQDLTLAAVKAVSTNNSTIGSTTRKLTSETVTGNLLMAGGNLVLNAADNILSTSSDMQAQNGILALFAGGDVILDAETERDYSYSKSSRTSSGTFSSTRRTTTSTRESVDTVGNTLAAQDIQIQAGGLAHLHASQLNAENNISISATDIAITAGIDQTYRQDTSVRTSTFRRSTSDRGSLNQSAAGSELNAANIQLEATGVIQLTASELNASKDLIIGNLAVEQREDGSFKAINGDGTPDQLIVDTLELRNEDWSHRTSGYRGAAATLAKGVAVISGAVLETLAPNASKPEITLSRSSSNTETRISQQTSELNAGNNLVMAASEQIQVIGGQLNALGTAILSASNITLDAAEETSITESTRSRESVSGIGTSVSKDEITLGGMQLTEHTKTERVTETTLQGTSINAGNLVMLADQDISILASKVTVEHEAILQAEGDITIGGRQEEKITETIEQTDTTTITAGVRNAYVDAALAVQGVYEATKALDDANDAYRDAKRRVERGELAESALKDYEINRAAAAAQLAQAQIAAGGAVAGAATAASSSMGTGFYASVGAEHTSTTTQTSVTQNQWQGSSISAGSLSLNSTNATIQGSDISAGLLNLGSQNVLITAGLSETQTRTSSSTDTKTASFGTNGNASLGASNQQSESQSSSTAHVNSRISVGHLTSNSDNLSLIGADVQAQTANLNVGNLTVESLQDTYSSSNSSRGNSVGAGFGSNGLSSINAGYNQGSGQAEGALVNNQTQLLIADGENSQITAQHTSLTGGLIANASRDEQGNYTDHGQLNLTTGTLSVAHLEDSSSSRQSGFGIQTSLGVQQNESGNRELSGGSSTLSMNNQGQVTEGLTQATLGLGNIQVGGQTLSNNPDDNNTFEGLNRDLSQSQITTLDQQTGGLNAGITIDHRLLSLDGINEILDQQSNFLDNSKTVIGGATADLARVTAVVGSALDLSLDQASNAWDTVGRGQALAYTEDGKLAGNVEDMRDGTIQDGQMLQDGLQGVANFINPDDGQQVRITEGATTSEGRAVYGAAHEDSNTMFVDIEGNRLNSLVNTVAHEGMHLNGAGETNATVTGYMTDLAYRVNAWANSDQISEHRIDPQQTPVGIQDLAAHQALLAGNNELYRALDDRGELDHRQAPLEAISYIREEGRVDRYMALINADRPENEQLTREQALQEMDRGLAAFEDNDWASAHGRNEVFEGFLAQELASDPAGTFTDNHGQTHALFAPTEESRADSQAGLLTLFSEYGSNQEVNEYLGNIHLPVEGAAGLYQQGYSQGYEQAGLDFSLTGDAGTLLQGVIGLPAYLYQSATSNEVGPLDDARMASYNNSLLLLQGRPDDAGFIAGYTDSETARLTWVGTAAGGGTGAILNRALGALAAPHGSSGRSATNAGTFPDSIFSSKAPKLTAPGTRILEGQHINDRGRVEPWRAHYDDYGRQIGRSDYNAGNMAQDIPSTHYHTREYSAEFPMGRSTGDHIPGEYKP